MVVEVLFWGLVSVVYLVVDFDVEVDKLILWLLVGLVLVIVKMKNVINVVMFIELVFIFLCELDG